MALDVLQIEFYNITVDYQITSATKLLLTLVDSGLDFHALRQFP